MSEKKEVKTQQEEIKEYLKADTELCKKHGYKRVGYPEWMKRDDGTFSLVMREGVEKLAATE